MPHLLTPYDRTLMALAEVNVPARAALKVVGPNRSGDPLIGYLGWMPASSVVDLCRAAVMSQPPDTYGSDAVPFNDPVALADYMIGSGTWRNPRGPKEATLVEAAVVAYAVALDSEPWLWLDNLHNRQRGRRAS